MNIFTKASDVEDPLTTWSQLSKREMKLAVTHPPNNYFGEISMKLDNFNIR